MVKESMLVKEVRSHVAATRTYESCRAQETHWAMKAQRARAALIEVERRVGALVAAEHLDLPGIVQLDSLCVRIEENEVGDLTFSQESLLGVADDSPGPEADHSPEGEGKAEMRQP